MMARMIFLLIVSLACYIYFVGKDVFLFLLMAFIIIFANRLSNKKTNKLTASTAIVLLIAGFAYIKIYLGLTSLIGYSVFAFGGISFLIDQHKTKTEYSPLDILLYLFFFPKMWAGPIIRINDFVRQSRMKLSLVSIYQGMKILLYAVFLKFVIADNLSISDKEVLGVNLFLSSFVWGIRFYLDFYAYSIIAVGLALMIGIELPYNFDKPYFSMTFRNFWNKWNITLSSWLRDYVYIPLGGNRKNLSLVCLNIVLTFIVSGLWHGISIPFVLWGVCHGLFVCMEHVVKLQNHIAGTISKTLYRLFVVFTVLLLWQMFKFQEIGDIERYVSNLLKYDPVDESTAVVFCLSVIVLAIIDGSSLLNKLVFQTNNSQKYILCEVTFFTLLIAILVLLPIHYSFNFFYLKF